MPKKRQHSGALSGPKDSTVPWYGDESWQCTLSCGRNSCLGLKRYLGQHELVPEVPCRDVQNWG